MTTTTSYDVSMPTYEEAQAMRAAREAARTHANLNPKVGDAATYSLYSDSYACTVVEVSKSGKQITLQRDKATLLNGFNSGEPDALTFEPGGFCGHTEGQQRYSYEADPNGATYRMSLRTRKDGSKVWKEVGQKTNGGCSARVGERNESYDFNF